MSATRFRSGMQRAVPWIWVGMSLMWAVVIIVTDQLAWPLALWIAATVGPLSYLSRSEHRSGSEDPQGKELTNDHHLRQDI